MPSEVSVSARGARGGAVIVLGQFVKLAIQLVSVVILSRLLAPEDFGLVAMAMVIMKFGELLRDFGMPTAALQARVLSHQQASNLFWINTLLGALATALAVALIPAIVAVNDEARLAPIAAVLATTLLLNGVQAQVQVQLARSMRFVALAVTDVAAQLIGLIAAYSTAVAGWGYWALVVQTLTMSLALLVMRFAVARWIPSRMRRGFGSMQLIRAGGNLGFAQILTFAASNADTVMVGAVWGASPLGQYNRAFQLLSLPIGGILGPLSTVVIPTVNAARKAGSSVFTLLLKLQFAVGTVIVWLFCWTATTAPSLIPVVLGPQWTSTITLFEILAIGGAFQAFSYISYWAFIVEQRERQLLYYNLVTKTLAILLIVVASFVSVESVAWAYSFSLAISWPINLIWLSRCAGQPSMNFLVNGLIILLAGVVAFLAGRSMEAALPPMSEWAEVAIGATVATIVFAAVLALFPVARRGLREGFSLAARMVKRSSGGS